MSTLMQTNGTFPEVARDQLILHYAPLVRRAVGSFAAMRPSMLDDDDLYSYGTVGLIDAIDRFDASRGVKFETYALTRIRGYLLDQLRALDWLPRTARSRARTVQRTALRMSDDLGRAPDRAELASASGLARAQCDRALVDGGAQVLSLDRLSTDGTDGCATALMALLEDEQSPNPARAAERRELHAAVAAALAQLPDRERELLRLRYVRNWTLRQVAAQMAISDGRASQLHTQAIERMRRLLGRMLGDLSTDYLYA